MTLLETLESEAEEEERCAPNIVNGPLMFDKTVDEAAYCDGHKALAEDDIKETG